MTLNQANSYTGNILVVDDTPDNVRLLAAMLTGEGYDVRKALNGKMALTACQRLLPDLILLDINMPGMDGYEVCQLLKSDEKTREIPIIFISALDNLLDKIKAFDAGGVDYITKPFQGAEVLSRVKSQLHLRSLQIQVEKQNLSLQKTLDELRNAQTQLIQNEKMLGLGQLVAGISHEINNPVSFIYGNLKYAEEYINQITEIIELYQQEYPNPPAKIQKLIQDIDLHFLMQDVQNIIDAMHRGSERIRQIVMSLQQFSRQDTGEMRRVNIHEGIESTLLILQHKLRESKIRPAIDIIKEYGNLPLISCYPSQLNQVFMNVLNNAIDAIEEKSLKNTQDNSYLPNPQIRIYTELPEENNAIIRIADNGTGIDESAKSRLFDPFFTTKPVGKGTGLGLAISYQIVVQKHQGNLTYFSYPGEGAEFVIQIPVKPTP
ncbi:MAG: response regulator [Nostocaceae cyanobacterium]|nr:response regulator [Nostocaceae cyanobacterium]